MIAHPLYLKFITLRFTTIYKLIEMECGARAKRDLVEEIDLLDTMLSSLVELLEEKGVVTQQEWEKRIKERVTIK